MLLLKNKYARLGGTETCHTIAALKQYEQLPKREIVEHVDDVAGVILVLLPKVLQDPDLLLRLPVEPLLIPDHFQRDMLVCLVVIHFQHLPK